MAWGVGLLMGEQLHVLDTCSCSVNQSVLPDSFQPHEVQHARLPCPSLSPGVCSNSCPLSQWCHPTISSYVIPFSHFQFFPASGSFPMMQFFPSGGQSIRVSASASVLSMNIQDRFPLGLIGWISLRDSQESPPTPQFKSISSSALSFPWYLSGKEWLQCRRWGLIPGLERSLGGGNGNPLQYSCLGSHPFSFKPLLWFRLHWGLLNWLIVLVN